MLGSGEEQVGQALELYRTLSDPLGEAHALGRHSGGNSLLRCTVARETSPPTGGYMAVTGRARSDLRDVTLSILLTTVEGDAPSIRRG